MKEAVTSYLNLKKHKVINFVKKIKRISPPHLENKNKMVNDNSVIITSRGQDEKSPKSFKKK